MAQGPAESLTIFGEDDFAWEEFDWAGPETTTLEPAPALRPVVRRRRRQTRTLAGDLARLRAALPGPTGPLALVAALVTVVALAVVIRTALGGDESPRQADKAERTAPRAGAKLKPITVPSPRTTAVRTLEPGDEGTPVRDLQTALAALGYYAQAPDGGYGPGTSSAVATFQQAKGLAADGVAGPQTAEALVAALVGEAEADVDTVEDGLAAAVAGGTLPSADADRYRSTVADAVELLAKLPPGRSAAIALVLNDVAAQADAYEAPRALAAFSMLAATADFVSDHAVPASSADIEDADGVVYRYYHAHGFQFQPLANFAKLNGLVRKGEKAEVRRLADALVARGVPAGDALAWEYYFPFGGPSRWTSGLAQSAGAQALARAGRMLGDPTILRKARAAYRTIPQSLSMPLGGGLWVREYGFSDMPILNAQLQSIVSLNEYTDITGDAGAGDVSARMSAAARALIAQFDTGCWSRYSLGGNPATPAYHAYHVSLLRKLAKETGDPLWADYAERWDGYVSAGGCATA